VLLNRRLNRHAARRLLTVLTCRIDGRRLRRPNLLAEVCRAVNAALRQSKKMARADPHLFGPQARKYFLDTIQLEKDQEALNAELRKVYGTSADAHPPSTVWQDRYCIPPASQKLFRKWFREFYG